jgi:putative endonuclease
VGSDPRHRLGCLGEHLAAQHLERLGFRILERNYRTRFGELDIIAYDGQALVFCEVKTRRLAGLQGGPLEAVHQLKRGRIRRMAMSWLNQREHRPCAPVLRFDVIGVTLDRAGRLASLEHLEAAF